MKRVVLESSRAWIEDCPDLTPERGWVIAKVLATPICGSDIKAFRSPTPVRSAGHEGVGEIVDTGGSQLVQCGERVVLNPLTGCGRCYLCRGGDYIYCQKASPPGEGISHFAQYVKIKDFLCTPIPNDIPDDIASLAGCALSPAFRALKQLGVSAFDTVLITGLGPVGLGGVVIAKFLGATVIAIEGQEYRQQLAKALGANCVLPPDENTQAEIQAFVKDKPLLKAIECSGHPSAQRLCVDVVAHTGSIAIVGENPEDIAIGPSNDLIRKGLTLFGVWHVNLSDFDNMMEVLHQAPGVSKLISHRFGFRHVQQAFDTFTTKNTAKVLLDPWD